MVIGYIMWAVYHLAFVIILLNMLIAIMTNCYQETQDQSDLKWKSARAHFWMYYIKDHNRIAPPFNVFRFFCFIVHKFFKKKKDEHVCKQTKYFAVLQKLTDRYEKKYRHKSAFKDRTHITKVSYVKARKLNFPNAEENMQCQKEKVQQELVSVKKISQRPHTTAF